MQLKPIFIEKEAPELVFSWQLSEIFNGYFEDLDPDPEKPGPWKSWTQKNLGSEKPGSWKRGKQLDAKKKIRRPHGIIY